MKFQHLALCLILGGINQMVAGESVNFTNSSGRVYTNAMVVRADPDGLVLRFQGGGAKIPFEQLPELLQVQYGYDPEKVRLFIEAERLKREARQKEAARLAAERLNLEAAAARRQRVLATRMIVMGPVARRISTGLLVDSYRDRLEAEPSGYRVNGDLRSGSISVSGPSTIASASKRGMPVFIGLCFVEDHPDYTTLRDSNPIEQVVYPNGTFTYEPFSGERRTVPKFTANPARVTTVADPATMERLKRNQNLR
ncbi:MAG: hypothetical protein HYZ36_02115 [Pedosphaera parvula]|nr:hypothetical protein [Pedosphaera parvula]